MMGDLHPVLSSFGASAGPSISASTPAGAIYLGLTSVYFLLPVTGHVHRML